MLPPASSIAVPASLDSLPTEIVEAVLRCLLQHPDRDKNVKSFIAALCTCQILYRIGLPCLWMDVVINKDKLPNFNREITSAHTLFVQSLTLQVTPIIIPSIQTQDGFAVARVLPFSNLGDTLPQMLHLKTLSITVRNDLVGKERRPDHVEEDSLGKILLASPESLEDLEVNALGFDGQRSGGYHFCSILNKLLSRLRNVKIFVSTLCHQVFKLTESQQGSKADEGGREGNTQTFAYAKFPNLRTFILHASYDSGALCPSTSKEALQNQACINNMRVVEAAEAAFAGNHLPTIQRFVIMDTSDTLDALDHAACTALFERDFVARQTFCNPFVHYRGLYEYMIRYKDKNGAEVEALGRWMDLLEQVTGPAWIESLGGPRFPAEFKETRKAIDGGYSWKEVNLIRDCGIAGIIDTTESREFSRLLRLEKRAGRRLLKPRTTTSVTDVAPLLREVLEDESADEGSHYDAGLDGDGVSHPRDSNQDESAHFDDSEDESD